MAIVLKGKLLRERHVENGQSIICLFQGREVIVVDMTEIDGEEMYICEDARIPGLRFEIDTWSVALRLPEGTRLDMGDFLPFIVRAA